MDSENEEAKIIEDAEAAGLSQLDVKLLRSAMDRVNAMGWNPEDPSDDCRAALELPSAMFEVFGPRLMRLHPTDRLGLTMDWIVARTYGWTLKGDTKGLPKGGRRLVQFIALSHIREWYGQAIGLDLSEGDSLRNAWLLAQVWQRDRRQPQVEEFCRLAEELLKNHEDREPLLKRSDLIIGRTSLFLTHESKLVSIGVQRGQLIKGLSMGYQRHHKSNRKEATEAAAELVNSGDEAMEWIWSNLGASGAVGYLGRGMINISPQKVRDKMPQLIEPLRPLRDTLDVRHDADCEDIESFAIEDQDLPIEIDDVLKLLGLGDVSSLTVEQGIARIRSHFLTQSEPAALCAIVRQKIPLSRPKLAALAGVSVDQIRYAESALSA